MSHNQRRAQRGSAGPVRRVRGRGGFTLLEAVLVIFVTSLGILAVALGLLTAVNADGRANRQQRLNAAMSTFTEAVRRTDWIPPTCPAVSSPAPRSNDTNLGANPSHAGLILSQALGDPAVADWVDRGVQFSVTGVEYWGSDPQGKPIQNGNGFTGGCADAPYSWPVARVQAAACFTDSTGQCVQPESSVSSTTSKRGFRRNTPGNP